MGSKETGLWQSLRNFGEFEMKKLFFDDIGKKYRLSQLVKIEDEVTRLEKELAVRKDILKVAETREKSKKFWNDATPQERANFGKSPEEIAGTANYRSPIDYACVSDLEFDDLNDFWKAAFLVATADYMLKNTPEFTRTQKNEEAQS